MKKTNYLKMIGIFSAVMLLFALVSCGDGAGGPDPDPVLPGSVYISPASGIEVGDILTANYTGGPDGVTVSYQWKRGATTVGTNSVAYQTQAAGSHTVTVSAWL